MRKQKHATKQELARPDRMADKMVVGDKELAASLPVTVEKTNKKAPPLPAVQLVCLWVLLTAAILIGCSVLATTLVDHYYWTLPSWSFARPGPIELQPSCSPSRPGPIEPTDAKAAEVSAIRHGMLWCSAAAAAIAALALLLPGRHRRVLACIVLAATATSHLMAASTTLVLTDLGRDIWWILVAFDMSFLAAGDIICFLALLGRGAYANVPAVDDHLISLSLLLSIS